MYTFKKINARILFYYWMPVIVYCAAIFVQSSYPSPLRMPNFSHSDKIAHFFGYALLGALLMRAYMATLHSKYIKTLITISLFSAMMYAASDELHQSFVKCRTGDILDFLADALGGAFGILAYWLGAVKYRSVFSKIVD